MLALSCMPYSSSSTAYAGVCGSEGMTYEPREKMRMKVKSIPYVGGSNDNHARKMPNHSDL